MLIKKLKNYIKLTKLSELPPVETDGFRAFAFGSYRVTDPSQKLMHG